MKNPTPKGLRIVPAPSVDLLIKAIKGEDNAVIATRRAAEKAIREKPHQDPGTHKRKHLRAFRPFPTLASYLPTKATFRPQCQNLLLDVDGKKIDLKAAKQAFEALPCCFVAAGSFDHHGRGNFFAWLLVSWESEYEFGKFLAVYKATAKRIVSEAAAIYARIKGDQEAEAVALFLENILPTTKPTQPRYIVNSTIAVHHNPAAIPARPAEAPSDKTKQSYPRLDGGRKVIDLPKGSNLSACEDAITKHIENNRFGLVVAPTGSGKTWGAEAVALRLVAANKVVAFVVPTRLLGEQAAKKAGRVFIDGSADGHDIQLALESRFFFITQASIDKLKEGSVDVFFIDEGHLLADDLSFRPQDTAKIVRVANWPNKPHVCLLTATPQAALYQASLSHETSISTLEVRIPQPDLHTEVREYRGDAETLAYARVKAQLQKKDVLLVELNDKDALDRVAAKLVREEVLTAAQVAVIYSHDTIAETEAFKVIRDEQKLPADVRLVLCTKFMEYGVSVNTAGQDVGLVVIHNDYSPSEAGTKQFQARPRTYKTLSAEVWVKYKKPQPEKPAQSEAQVVAAALSNAAKKFGALFDGGGTGALASYFGTTYKAGLAEDTALAGLDKVQGHDDKLAAKVCRQIYRDNRRRGNRPHQKRRAGEDAHQQAARMMAGGLRRVEALNAANDLLRDSAYNTAFTDDLNLCVQSDLTNEYYLNPFQVVHDHENARIGGRSNQQFAADLGRYDGITVAWKPEPLDVEQAGDVAALKLARKEAKAKAHEAIAEHMTSRRNDFLEYVYQTTRSPAIFRPLGEFLKLRRTKAYEPPDALAGVQDYYEAAELHAATFANLAALGVGEDQAATALAAAGGSECKITTLVATVRHACLLEYAKSRAEKRQAKTFGKVAAALAGQSLKKADIAAIVGKIAGRFRSQAAALDYARALLPCEYDKSSRRYECGAPYSFVELCELAGVCHQQIAQHHETEKEADQAITEALETSSKGHARELAAAGFGSVPDEAEVPF